MQTFSVSPAEMLASLWRHRELTYALIKREVVGRYRGSFMGILWSLLNPLFMLAVYTFVFSVVFKARWGEGGDSKTEFALMLFAGLMVFNIFSECISRAPGLILANVNYVKKVVFPLEILPWVGMGAALFQGMISFIVWLGAALVLTGGPSITLVYVPLIVLPLVFFSMGLSWFLASLGVYLRDITQFVSVLLMVMMFMSPIFYPISAIPPEYREAFSMNPMAMIIEQVRGALQRNESPDAAVLFFGLVFSLMVAWAGFFWFQKTRKGFADVI